MSVNTTIEPYFGVLDKKLEPVSGPAHRWTKKMVLVGLSLPWRERTKLSAFESIRRRIRGHEAKNR
jgi:hypothetical protein